MGELSDQALARQLVSEGLGPCYVPKVLPSVDVRYARSIWDIYHPDTSPPRGVPIRLTEDAVLVWDTPRRDKAIWALLEYELRRTSGVRVAEAILSVYRNGLAEAEVQTMRPWNINELFALCSAFEEGTVVLEDCSQCGQRWFQHASVTNPELSDTNIVCEYCSLETLGGFY